ncbi:MAG: efflux RND transporter permease subunit, partial [Candidatus Aminicenantaceae bacterium]
REPENQKNLITRIFLYPFKLWKRLFHIILNCFSWFIDFILSFFMQLFILVFYYVSLPFKPVVRKIFEFHNNIYRRFSELYHGFLLWSLNNKFEVITGSFLFLVFTFLIAIQIPRELMPKPEEKSFELHVKTPIDYSFEQTVDIASWIEKKLKGKEAVETIFSQIGVISGMEGQNPDISSNSVNIYVKLKKYSYLETVINDLREELDQFAGLKYSIAEEQSTLSELLAFSSAEIGLKVKGNDLKKLREIADNAVKGLKSIEGMADVNHSIEEGKPEFLVKIKKKSLEKYAISSEVVSRFLIDAVRGRIATQFREMEKRYNIIVRLEEEARENVKTLMDQQIKYKDTFIPLRELVDFETIRGPKEIRRENQQREVLITANLRRKKISQVIPQIRETIGNLELPPDYRVVYSGEQEEMNRSFKSLIFAFCLAAFLVYMIMAAQFESLKHPFLILFTLPMGLSGAVWALFLTGQSFNVISVIGIVVLAGIVVNDAIVKIDYTNQLRKKGVALRQAVMEASRVKLRPILMTSVTTIFGLFPMSLGMGKGSELQQPLAISIIGGLIFSTFLTLILIPVSYELTGRNK